MTKNILVEGPITPQLVNTVLGKLQEDTSLGGHSIFLGQVRADIKGSKKVAAIEYTAYESMAGRESSEIIDSVLRGFEDVHVIKILHSVGRVNAGEISLFVAVSGGHRRQAIEACSKIVEMIKTSLPVWKKEIYSDSSHEWITDSKS